MAQSHVDAERLPAALREIVDNAVGSAELEGVAISDDHRRLAATFLTGQIDEAEYEAEALALALAEEPELDS
jgi:Antitoxin VbhA